MMFRVAYRTLSGGVQSFVANWTVNVSGVNPTSAATYQAGVRFTELRRDPGTGDVSIQNQVTYAPGSGNGASGRNLWMGSAAQDHQGNSAVGFSASSTTLMPSLMWAGRLAGDPANTLNQGEATVFAGTGVQQGSSSRWGDYSALTVDPSDDCTFFYTQEYYANNGSFDWATRVGKFAYPGCVAAPRGTVSGTVTVCGGGAPLAGAVVSDGLGHVRVTDAAGHYAMDLPPGSYTITIAKPGYSSGGGAAVVTNGNTTTLDACLAGVPILASAGATLTAESCQPPNGVIDPGETVTASLCLQNTGGADTTDLVATLAATGGVVNPPGPVELRRARRRRRDGVPRRRLHRGPDARVRRDGHRHHSRCRTARRTSGRRLPISRPAFRSRRSRRASTASRPPRFRRAGRRRTRPATRPSGSRPPACRTRRPTRRSSTIRAWSPTSGSTRPRWRSSARRRG